MSSLVDSTYRALVSRLQRGGTGTRPVSRPAPLSYGWGFEVFTPGGKAEVNVMVEVKILTNNVYKNDKVCITVSGLVSSLKAVTMNPNSGNCPSLDYVEAFVRKSLAEKEALPPQAQTSSSNSEPVKISVDPEPDPQPEPQPEPEPEPQPRHRRRGRRQDSDDQPETSAPVAE